MSYVEWLLCCLLFAMFVVCLLVAMFVVGGALYGIIKAIIWLKDHDWKI